MRFSGGQFGFIVTKCAEIQVDETDLGEKNDFEDTSFNNKPNDDFYYYKYISMRYVVKLIGCDLTNKEGDYIYREQDHYNDVALEKGRENKMIEIITTYLEKSSKLIVIIGNTHAKHICEINETLKNATYLFILLNNSSETPEN